MKFSMKFDMNNAAFADAPEEVERILHKVAAKVKDGQTEGAVLDLNGASVGRWSITGRHADNQFD